MNRIITTFKVAAMCVLAYLFSGNAQAQQITIGGGAYNGVGTYGPIRATTVAGQTNRHAYIYNSLLLGGMTPGNTISNLSFRVPVNTAFTGPCNFKIYLADTSALDWGAGTLNWAAGIAGTTLVYDQDISTIMGNANTWKKFNINDWTYNGGNLVVLCEYTQTGAQAAEYRFFYDNDFDVPLYVANQTKYDAAAGTPPAALTLSEVRHPQMRISVPSLDNAGIASIVSIIGSCNLGNETITVDVSNDGSNALNNIPVSYLADGVTLINETIPFLAAGGLVTHTFATQANFSAVGPHSLSVFTSLPNDSFSGDDSLSLNLYNSLSVSSFPYLQDFETDNGGFYTSGTTTFEYGTPAGSSINAAASGTKAWTTGLTTQYNSSESGYVQSPCFDLSSFSAGTSPALGLKVWWDSENGWDNTNIKYSTDGGATFQLLGTVAPTWYNRLGGTTFSGPMKQDSWSGIATNIGSGGWVSVRQSLAGITGTNVIFRIQFSSDGSVIAGDGFAFDDFSIFDNSSFTDAAAVSAKFPVASGCGLSGTLPLTIKVANLGGSVLTNLPVSYSVNGGASATETLAGPINPADTVSYTFTAQVNVGIANTYNILVTTAATGDGDASNDSTSTSLTNSAVISSFPYLQDFELGQGGFYASADSTTFAYGTPAGATINSAASGTKAWTTGLTTQYNNNERGYVQSPCFNFTGVSNPEIKLKVWWDSEQNYDNANIKYSTDGGLTFQLLGAVQPNWYNKAASAIIGPMKQDSWTGVTANSGSGAWVPVSYLAPSLGGQANVIFRIQFSSDGSVVSGDGFAFDDFQVSSVTAQLSPFALLTPPTNTILNVVGAPSQLVNIRWQKTNSSLGLPITYTWLADAPGGNFANPVLAVPANNSGADTVLTFSYAALNNLLAARNLRVGDTLKFIWTVRATDGTLSRFAAAPNFLQVRRGQLVSNVTFKVNMSNEGAISPNGVHMAGEMNAFNPNSPALVAGTGGVYSVTYTLNVQDTVEYIYLNGNAWSTEEIVPIDCGLPALITIRNRFYIVPVQDNATIATVCFARCTNCAVATNDLGFGDAISLYPNPTSGNTTLAFNLAEANNVTITLYNAMGETLQVQTEKGVQAANIALNTNNLASGVYFVQINNGNQYAVKQLIIQK